MTLSRILQTDCGSIKGAGVLAIEGTEHYLPSVPWRRILAKFNDLQFNHSHVETLSHKTATHSFSSDDHEFSRERP